MGGTRKQKNTQKPFEKNFLMKRIAILHNSIIDTLNSKIFIILLWIFQRNYCSHNFCQRRYGNSCAAVLIINNFIFLNAHSLLFVYLGNIQRHEPTHPEIIIIFKKIEKEVVS